MYRHTYTTQTFQVDVLPHALPPESQSGHVDFQPAFDLGLVPDLRPLRHHIPLPPLGLTHGLLGLVAWGAPRAGPGSCMPICIGTSASSMCSAYQKVSRVSLAAHEVSG